MIVVLILAIPQVVKSDGFIQARSKVVITPETTYCTADCVTKTEVFTKEDFSITCNVSYCRNDQCELVPNAVSDCHIN